MTLLVAAASTALAGLLADSPAPGTGYEGTAWHEGAVRYVGMQAVGVEIGGRMVVLAAASNTRTMPCTVIVPELARLRAWVGDPVLVSGWALTFPRGTVTVVRWWSPARVRPGDGWLRNDVRKPAGAGLDEATWDRLLLAAHALAAGLPGAPERLIALLGRGPGSTPAADDAVAGVLLAARALQPAPAADCIERAGRQVAAAAPSRTTALAAELLRHAAEGMAAPVVLHALTSCDPEARRTLLRLGGTSGAATVGGIDAVHLALGAQEQAA